MNESRIVFNGIENLYQVNKQKAERLYNQGIAIYTIANNASYSYGSFMYSKTKNRQIGIFWVIFDKEYTQRKLQESEKVNDFNELVNERLYYTPRKLGICLKFYVNDISLI